MVAEIEPPGRAWVKMTLVLEVFFDLSLPVVHLGFEEKISYSQS